MTMCMMCDNVYTDGNVVGMIAAYNIPDKGTTAKDEAESEKKPEQVPVSDNPSVSEVDITQ